MMAFAAKKIVSIESAKDTQVVIKQHGNDPDASYSKKIPQQLFKQCAITQAEHQR